jgi:hypothetical protein
MQKANNSHHLLPTRLKPIIYPTPATDAEVSTAGIFLALLVSKFYPTNYYNVINSSEGRKYISQENN